jgi:predicted permease
MRLVNTLRALISTLFRRTGVEQEMDEEMRAHIERRAEELERSGVAREEAERRARIEFGGVERFKEECREERGGMWPETVWNDVKFGLRMLRKSPGFTATAVLTLALGIGANTAVFSVVNAVVLRPLPYGKLDRLVIVKEWIPKAVPDPIPVCAPDVVQIQRENQTFEALAGFKGDEFDFDAGEEPRRVHVDRVSASLFSVLGAQPAIGRAFAAEEDQPGHLVAILSNGFWERQFASNREVIGRSVTLNRRPYVVIGVMPRGMVFPLAGMDQGEVADIFVPMAFTAEELAGVGDNFNYSVVGRLKAGVSVAQASADLEGIARHIEETYPAEIRSQFELSAVVLPLTEQVVGKVRPLLLLLLGAVGFVLLIGCINIGNLLLARATDREREIAVRLALGASRWRLLRQLMAESMLLTVTGAGAGLAFAYWTTDVLVALMPKDIPLFHEVGVNTPVLGFTLGLAVLTGLVFGILPAVSRSRADVNGALKEGGRTGMQGLEQHGLRGALVVTEVALAMVLLVGAGLLLRSFQRVVETDPGFRPERVLTASLNLPESQYKEDAQTKSFYQQLMRRLQQMPGAKTVGASTDLPLESGWTHLFTPEGYQPPPGANLNRCNHSVILGDYLQAMGVPLIRGRYFTEQDNENSVKVLIVSESLAKRYWPKEDAIEKRLKWGTAESKDPWLTIVGVVGDVKPRGLDMETTQHTYEPYLQLPGSGMNVAVRTSVEPESMAAQLRRTVWSVDPELAVARLRTMEEVIRESTSPRRFSLLLLGSFALLALVLAAIGIYGVISYAVVRRVHEIGIRMALGAQERDVMKLVLKQSMAQLGAGIAIGIAGALAVTRLLGSLLYGVRPTDPTTIGGVVVLLAGVAVAASLIPARRAMKVDPMVALRYE